MVCESAPQVEPKLACSSVKEDEGGEKRGTAREAVVLDTVLQNPDL